MRVNGVCPTRTGDITCPTSQTQSAISGQFQRHQGKQRVLVDGRALGLVDWVAVPCEPQPVQIVHNPSVSVGPGSRSVDVLDAQQHAPASAVSRAISDPVHVFSADARARKITGINCGIRRITRIMRITTMRRKPRAQHCIYIADMHAPGWSGRESPCHRGRAAASSARHS